MDVLLPIVKLLHLGALILWLGPALGAWWLLLSANRMLGEPTAVSHLLYTQFFKIVWLEHVAFMALLLSGFLYAWLAGFSFSGMPWLKLKLLLIALIVLPLEIVDIWFSHTKLTQTFKKRDPDTSYSAAETGLLSFYHGGFTRAALILLPATVLGIMWLTIAKPV